MQSIHATPHRWLLGLAVLWLLHAGSAQAQPAPWFWWVSKLDSTQRVCAQHMPAKGWERGAGPFANAQCQAPQRTLIYQRPPQPQSPK